jgi:hypothetical protein
MSRTTMSPFLSQIRGEEGVAFFSSCVATTIFPFLLPVQEGETTLHFSKYVDVRIRGVYIPNVLLAAHSLSSIVYRCVSSLAGSVVRRRKAVLAITLYSKLSRCI